MRLSWAIPSSSARCTEQKSNAPAWSLLCCRRRVLDALLREAVLRGAGKLLVCRLGIAGLLGGIARVLFALLQETGLGRARQLLLRGLRLAGRVGSKRRIACQDGQRRRDQEFLHGTLSSGLRAQPSYLNDSSTRA